MNNVAKAIKQMCAKVHNVFLFRKWKQDYRWLKCHCVESYEVLDRIEDKQLYLIPHADDDLLGGYALAKLQKKYLIYGYYGMTGKNKEIANKIIRDNEFQAYANKVGISYQKVTSNKDLSKIILDYNVRFIYLPSIFDWHPEHRRLNYDLYDALNNLNRADVIQIIWYGVTIPICARGNKIVPMTREDQIEKYDIFNNIYVSQNFMPIQRFIIQEKINALNTDYYAAEAFCVLSLEKWRKVVNQCRLMESDEFRIAALNLLKKRINEIKEIREISRNFYYEYL